MEAQKPSYGVLEFGLLDRSIQLWNWQAFSQAVCMETAYARSNLDCLAPYFKSGSSSAMIWVSFRGRKFWLIHIGQKRGAAFEFIEQVYDIITSRRWTWLNEPVLIEDGTPIHRSNEPKKWRDERVIANSDWPAKSPHLNPMKIFVSMTQRSHQKLPRERRLC